MKNKKINLFVFLTFLITSSAQSDEKLPLESTQAILIDTTTDQVLFDKGADVQMLPSSMTKILTMYLVFEELKAGRLKLDDTFVVSEKAWRKQGSKMFVKVGDRIRIDDLIRGVIVQSGNDASIVLAEGIAGSEEAFATQMTHKARELGASCSNFVNATGWPDENHYSTPRDLALIAERTIKDFPEYYHFYREMVFIFNGIRQMNRNPLLYTMPECDGLKTGNTDEGGYGVVASAIQDGRRLIMVVNGAKSKKERAKDSEALMRWGFSYYVSPLLFKASEVVEKVDVWLGNKSSIEMLVEEDVYVTLPRHESKNLKIEVKYQSPIPAPIKAGQRVGTLIIKGLNTNKDREIPLVAGSQVEKADFIDRIKAAIHYLLFGHN
ncbi:MAG: D-alanyl-D-alanine carboxypeptidase [Candidatus Paracaedimonas acanthamoebae]|uniref:serine-type D-Ala-D-Ala carboxypeptidase n=1 Tax=Candidatus Paracaedimonas acanthamoebae TaxID=244581 RepID=A0A8J7PSB9_9PROT|nr:D-alanyl-D-alanine carboxypeptidase [Candidatus Paracaedimonas acanthamoebae]